MTEDPVSAPKHYTSHPSGVECVTITRHMGFNLGNAMKYIWRADLKNDAVQDLQKAIWYVQDEIMKRTKTPDNVGEFDSAPGSIYDVDKYDRDPRRMSEKQFSDLHRQERRLLNLLQSHLPKCYCDTCVKEKRNET